MVIYKEFTFEASHVLPKHPGKCSRLHGHSWQLCVAVSGEINQETGFLCDYGALKDLVDRHVIFHLDHSHLGYGTAWTTPIAQEVRTRTLPDEWYPYFGQSFYPSSENLCRAIFKLLKPLVKELGLNVRLHEVQIKETCTSGCSYNWRDDESTDATDQRNA